MEKVEHPDLPLTANESELSGHSLKASRSTNNELLNTCTYGIEYVIDEIFKDTSNKPEQHSVIDWSGISDLIID